MELVIDRRMWYRGRSGRHSKLLVTAKTVADARTLVTAFEPSINRDCIGLKCCLGFLALACGLTEAEIGNVSCVHDLRNVPEQLKFLVDVESNLSFEKEVVSSLIASDLMNVNDDKELLPDERERRLQALFAQHGIEVKFIN